MRDDFHAAFAATIRVLASLCLSSSMHSAVLAQESSYVPGREWKTITPAQAGLDAKLLKSARDYASSAGGSGMIVRDGAGVTQWGDQQQKYDLKSTSKSIGVTAFGLAIDERKLRLSDRAALKHPSFGNPPESNEQTGWLDEVTLRQLANQSAGFAKPGGYERLLFRPGTRWHYSDGGPNWLAECVTLAMQQDIESLLFDRVFSHIGINRDDLHWRRHQYRPSKIGDYRRCEFGSGVHANVDAMARIGLLYMRNGRWGGRQLLSSDFIKEATSVDLSIQGLREWEGEHGDASEHYGLLWWNNADGALEEVPTDAFWSWGLHDSLIAVVPSLGIVVARTGRSWPRADEQVHYAVLKPFLEPICQAAQPATTDGLGNLPPLPPGKFAPLPPSNPVPCPPSELGTLRWAPPNTIRRLAKGSDNWPITWMDDGDMLTAYGDGWGFEPKVKEKLSMGFARIQGDARDARGVNVRSTTGERYGSGEKGVKASGMLMVDGVVYLFARNAGNSKIAWSEDRGATWDWCDWRFETSFGCPSFVNCGRNHESAPDDMIYVVSPDSDSAYDPADQMVLARVKPGLIRDREAYEYFAGLNSEHEPLWSLDPTDRVGIFEHPGRCYRGGMTYSAELERYLWCQVLPDSTHSQGPRFEGGFGVYEATQPWGPWSTLFYTEHWDVGPGESSSLPVKWMERDGRTFHLLFSGDDAFSIRRAVLISP